MSKVVMASKTIDTERVFEVNEMIRGTFKSEIDETLHTKDAYVAGVKFDIDHEEYEVSLFVM